MRLLRLGLSLLLSMVLLMGCAGVAERMAPAEMALCLPPGIADVPPPATMVYARWVNTTHGPGMLIHYHVGERSIDVLWVEGVVMAIDPDAQDPTVPVWIRRSLDRCEWTREIVGGQLI